MDTFYQVEQVYELPNISHSGLNIKVYPLDYNWYKIIKIKEYPPGSEIKFIVIGSEAQASIYNAYGTIDEFNPYNLVTFYTPLTLIEAKTIFPEMNFTKSNYGFKKMDIPPEFTGSAFYGYPE